MTNDSTAVDFGINLLEEEIDDVIFRTNEFLTDATFTGGQGPFWWILQMSMALAGLFAIIMCANMAYKMMVKREPLDVMKLFKPLAISIILCWWYPPADTGIGGGRSSWCALDLLSYIPNAIGSYTHDLYEAEAAQVEDRMADVQQLMYQLGDEASDPMSTIKAASNAVSTLLTQSSVQDVTDADAAAEDEKNIVKAEMTSTSAGLVMMIDKIIMLIALITFRIGWWGTIYCQQILLGMLTIFGPIQWAFSLLPKWESAWARWLIRYLTVHFYGAMLYFVGYFYNLTHSVSVRLYSNIQHLQQTCTKIAIKKSNEGGARAYWQVGIEKMNVFLFRLSSHLSLVWSCFLSNFCPRISPDFGLVIWHEVAMFDIFSNQR
ncbi:hypothetical protein [uncultured Prevotella sp.]|uniref:hypothetical protein n=1 Tax=uncultured Prevotella sp. TaxID=159272 RepID=UPI0026158D3C|nr:hypothetical protein [uncultured Prevotella sp.]